uniref:Dihydroflavonol-4-reductase n=1 Tax=Anthurium amnicola TaxID=1678845 RepID=A0A1D1XN36_9ARAE
MAPAPLQPTQKTVCVMDAGGRVGAALVERLLMRGYTVHAATQGDPRGLLKALPSGDGKRLEVFWADPFDYQSLLDAVKGCSGLFYAFEPPPDMPCYDEHMVEVEVRAAHNVLEACAQTETVEKVVFSSSATAIVWKEDRGLGTAEFDERDWSEPGFCQKFKLWHALAKTLAEKTAWALAMDRGVNMVAINSGLLTGPGLSIANPYLKGAAEMYEDGVLVAVDDWFLADAHVCAFEDSSAYGRYLCFNRTVCLPEDAIELAKMMAPTGPCPPTSDGLKIILQRIHSKKLNKLMVGFDGGVVMETVH